MLEKGKWNFMYALLYKIETLNIVKSDDVKFRDDEKYASIKWMIFPDDTFKSYWDALISLYGSVWNYLFHRPLLLTFLFASTYSP